MASQISYVKLIRQNFRQRGWAFALTWIMALIAMPLVVMIQIENKIQWANEVQSGFTRADLFRWFQGAVGPANWYIAVFVILSALLLGVTGFSYLHSREKTDFYHSLPMRREQLMAGNYLSGVLMFLIPYIVSYLLVLFVGKANKIPIGGMWIWCIQTVLVTILLFLLFYTLTVLAMILTGKILSGILMSVLLWTYGTIVAFIVEWLCRRFYITYFSESHRSMAASPMEIYVGFIKSFYSQELPGTGWYFSILGVLAVAVILAVLCYRIRPTEAVGNALVFPKFEGFFKIMLTIPGALLCGLFVSMNAAKEEKWLLVSSLLAAVLLALVIEFVYHLDLRNVFRIRFSMIFSVIAVIVCIYAFKYDFAGYDEYMPKEAEVEGIGIKFDTVLKYLGDQSMLSAEESYLEKLEIKNTQEIYDILTEIVKEQDTLWEQEEETGWYPGITVMYHLENGRRVYRHYKLEEKDNIKFAKMMLEMKEYSEKVFNIDDMLEHTFSDGYIRDLKSYESVLLYNQKELRKLMEIYSEDLRSAASKQFMTDKIIAELSVSYADKNNRYGHALEFLPVYESFNGVKEYLEATGYRLNEGFVPSEVMSMTIEDYRDKENPDEYAEESEKTVITEQEKIAELFPYLERMDFNSIWNGKVNMKVPVDVSIVWKDGSVSVYTLDEEGEALL